MLQTRWASTLTAPRVCLAHPTRASIRCRSSDDSLSSAEGPSPADPSSSSSGQARARRPSLQDAMSRSLTEVSRLKGRVTERRNLMMVDGDEETWRRLDQKVNTYPREAEFTAIGSGGADFKAAMVAAVEAVVGSLHSECVSERQSTEGRYISVRLSCHVATADDVIKIYENMRSDARLQFFI